MGHVPHLYLPAPWQDAAVAVDAVGLHHLRRALRRSDGDPVSYTDGAGVLGDGHLDGDRIVRGIEKTVPRPSRPVIAVAPPSQKDRVRFLVEKVAELGTLDLRWIRTRFSEGRPPAADKAAAWARSALEQSRSAWLMQVGTEHVDMSDLPEGTVFADRTGSRTVDLGAAPCVAIGPEAGWSADEVPERAPRVSLGPMVLRVETAAMAAAALANSNDPSNPDHSEW
ncbi:MAG: RsmE family RNA methyltransferase, partial [Acidimicrobiia bacterium]